MHKIVGVIRPYAWGSHTALAALRGLDRPTLYPEAELWFGAHPSDPAPVADLSCTLLDLITQEPELNLGLVNQEHFGSQLPFMVKILAADEPLSLQAHPSLEQAKLGFLRENAAMIPLDSPDRNYKDVNHKPEMLIALSEFELLAGFANPNTITGLWDELARHSSPENKALLANYSEYIAGQRDMAGIRAAFTTFVTLPATIVEKINNAVMEAATNYLATGVRSNGGPKAKHYADHCKVLIALGDRYPSDFGVLAVTLLNYVRLQPGQAVFVPAGRLHSYIRGLGVEVLANSDNVLRGGLTAKHVDVPELVKIVDFSPTELSSIVLEPRQDSANMVTFQPPVDEFLTHIQTLALGEEFTINAGAPRLVVCTQGVVQATNGADTIECDSGQGLWISAADEDVTFRSVDQNRPAVLFLTTTGIGQLATR